MHINGRETWFCIAVTAWELARLRGSVDTRWVGLKTKKKSLWADLLHESGSCGQRKRRGKDSSSGVPFTMTVLSVGSVCACTHPHKPLVNTPASVSCSAWPLGNAACKGSDAVRPRILIPVNLSDLLSHVARNVTPPPTHTFVHTCLTTHWTVDSHRLVAANDW